MRYPILLIGLLACTSNPSGPTDDRPPVDSSGGTPPPSPPPVDTVPTQHPDTGGTPGDTVPSPPPPVVWTVTVHSYPAGNLQSRQNPCSGEGVLLPNIQVTQIDSEAPNQQRLYLIESDTGKGGDSGRLYDFRRLETELNDTLNIDQIVAVQDSTPGLSWHTHEFDANPYDDTESTTTSECF